MTLSLNLCKICNEEKSTDDFYETCKNVCKPCYIARVIRNQKSNPELYKSLKLQYSYGITLEERDQMIVDQNNRCACCGDEFEKSLHTHVDHCHKTLKIRGILCHNCNKGLGNFQDDPVRLEKAKIYLEQNAQENTTTSVPTGPNPKGQEHSQHGTVSTAGTREDHYDLDHYQRTISGEDSDYRTQTRGGDSVGHRGKEVGTPQPVKGQQDNGEPNPAYHWIED